MKVKTWRFLETSIRAALTLREDNWEQRSSRGGALSLYTIFVGKKQLEGWLGVVKGLCFPSLLLICSQKPAPKAASIKEKKYHQDCNTWSSSWHMIMTLDSKTRKVFSLRPRPAVALQGWQNRARGSLQSLCPAVMELLLNELAIPWTAAPSHLCSSYWAPSQSCFSSLHGK